MGRLDGRVAIVTDGGGKLGSAICRALAREGAMVIINYFRDAEAARLLQDEILDSGAGGALAYHTNVRDFTAVEAMVEDVVSRYRYLDIMVNNYEITFDAMFSRVSRRSWDEVFEANVTSVFNCCHAALKHVGRRGHGRIINVSSPLVEGGGVGRSVYAASKGAVNAFSRSLALELAREGITVNVVSPGVMLPSSGRFLSQEEQEELLSGCPMHTYIKPEAVADAALFFALPSSAHVTGVVFPVDGGYSINRAHRQIRSNYSAVVFGVMDTLLGFNNPAPFDRFLETLPAEVLEMTGFANGETLMQQVRIASASMRHRAIGVGSEESGLTSFWHEVFYSVFRNAGTNSREIAARMTQWYKNGDLYSLYDDVVPALEALLGRGVQMGIVSNFGRNLEEQLMRHGIRPFFDFVVSSSSVGLAKPDPRIFDLAVERAGNPPGSLLYVGDHPIDDVEGARSAGMDFVLIDRHNRYTDAGLPRINSLMDVVSILFPTAPDVAE